MLSRAVAVCPVTGLHRPGERRRIGGLEPFDGGYARPVVVVHVEPDLWREWLDHYVGRCRAELSTSQLDELAGGLASRVDGTGALSRSAREPTAECERRLVGFLASVEHPPLRESLVGDAVAQ